MVAKRERVRIPGWVGVGWAASMTRSGGGSSFFGASELLVHAAGSWLVADGWMGDIGAVVGGEKSRATVAPCL
jgi:hypothetical protein